MKTISKNALLFALLVCCNQTIKSAAAAAADPVLDKSEMQIWLVQLQEAQKKGVLTMKEDPKAFSSLVQLILDIEVANGTIKETERERRKGRVIATAELRVNTLIKRLSEKLGIETEEEIERKLIEKELQNIRGQLETPEDSLAVFRESNFISNMKRLYYAKTLTHLVKNPELLKLCMLSAEEQKTHVESLKQDQQEKLLENLKSANGESNEFFQGLSCLLPKRSGSFRYSNLDLPDETRTKIHGDLRIGHLYRLLDDAIYPPSLHKSPLH